MESRVILTYRQLAVEEIAQLEGQGNLALGPEGWAGVRVSPFTAASVPRIHRCTFLGHVFLQDWGFEGEVEVRE